jgi:hypothetical protein
VTGSISRKLYQQFLLLYPEPFRREFGDEMLGVFEECRAAQGFWHLLSDVVLSAAKQQIHHRSTPVPKSAPLYSEIALGPNLARMLAVSVFGAALIAGVWVRGMVEARESWTVIRPETIFWFPIIPQGRFCSGPVQPVGNPEIIHTTGVLVRGNPEAPEYRTVVRSKTHFWISTTPWGQYCFDTPERKQTPQSIL